MDLLFYFLPPVLFILSCMTVVQLTGAKRKQFDWLMQSMGRWLATWAMIGFVIPLLLGALAELVRTIDVVGGTTWVWPFSIGLMALQGKPSALEILMVLSITALENALLYLVLGTGIWGVFHWIPKLWTPREHPPSILGH